jgi:hypothetical protein
MQDLKHSIPSHINGYAVIRIRIWIIVDLSLQR